MARYHSEFPNFAPSDLTIPTGYKSRRDPDIQRTIYNFRLKKTQPGWNEDEIPSDELRQMWKELYASAKAYLVEFGTFLNGFLTMLGHQPCRLEALDVLKTLANLDKRLLTTFYTSGWTSELILELAEFLENEPKTMHHRFSFAQLMEITLMHMDIKVPASYGFELMMKYDRSFTEKQLKYLWIPNPYLYRPTETEELKETTYNQQKLDVDCKRAVLERELRAYITEDSSFRSKKGRRFVGTAEDYISKHPSLNFSFDLFVCDRFQGGTACCIECCKTGG